MKKSRQYNYRMGGVYAMHKHMATLKTHLLYL